MKLRRDFAISVVLIAGCACLFPFTLPAFPILLSVLKVSAIVLSAAALSVGAILTGAKLADFVNSTMGSDRGVSKLLNRVIPCETQPNCRNLTNSMHPLCSPTAKPSTGATLLKQTLRDFFSPVANFKYTVSAIKGILHQNDRREDHKQAPPTP